MTAGAVTVAALVAAIVAVLAIHALRIMRAERGQKPGQPPGTGEVVFDVSYTSGLGGGQPAELRAPRDPQAFARLFVPRQTPKRDET